MATEELPRQVHLKTFKPKCDNLPLLEEYKQVLDYSNWNRWEMREGKVSWVDADKYELGE